MIRKPTELREPIQVNIVEQNRKDLEAYAEEVISNRAVVNIYGFKPVHMLMLYCAFATTKITNKTKKCARLVGDMLGVYHPHGDISTYDALLSMVNWYDCYIPLFRKQGNFGSFQGDGPASYRYTETGLTPFAMDCIIGDLSISDNVVDWTRNYDESAKQPKFLPIKVPILLINGTEGIAIGMKADIPSHNINEVIDATIRLIDNPNSEVVLRPDHCMKCEIIDTNWKSISNKGNGSYVVRSIIENGEYKGFPALYIKSLPNKTRLDPIKNSIEELKFTHLPQIISVHEDCTPTELKCIVKFRKGTDLNYAKSILYKKTNLQRTFRVNFQVYDPNTHQIIRLSYKAYLKFFIEFRKSTLFRLYSSKYQDIITRIHALKTYITLGSCSHLDAILEFVRHNRDMADNELIEALISNYSLTDLQASFIIYNNITKISRYHIEQYKEELYKLEQQANMYYDKIVDEDSLVQDIKNELLQIKEKYGCPRRCKIIRESDINGIPEGIFNVIITDGGTICKVEHRQGIPRFRNVKPRLAITVNNTENIILFDNIGKCYKLEVNKIPIYDGKSNGLDIRILIKTLVTDVTTILAESKINELNKNLRQKYYICAISRLGYIKKMELEEFLTISFKGTTYFNLNQGDYIQDIIIISDSVSIIVYSKDKAIRISGEEIPLLRRNTKGNKAMTCDHIDGISIATSNCTDVIVITNKGYVNRINIGALKLNKRGTSGTRVIKLDKDDYIQAIFGVHENDSLNITTDKVNGVFPVSEIPIASSISKGVKKMNNEEILISCGIVKG